MTIPSRLDCVVIGGGPAGSAAALTAAQLGGRVLLVERTRYYRGRIGETASGFLLTLLVRMGLETILLSGCHGRMHSTRIAWGGEIRERSALADPHGPGWVLDRAIFDRDLAVAAEQAGAVLCTGMRAAIMSADAGKPVSIRLVASSGAIEAVLAERVIIATGRNRAGLFPVGAKTADALCAIAGRFARHDAEKGVLSVEAAREGWWYSVSLPDGRLLCVLITDSDLIPAGAAARRHWWLSSLRRTTLISTAIDPICSFPVLTTHLAQTILRPSYQASSVQLAGDALATVDPLSGQGIVRALQSGITAAQIGAGLGRGGDRSAAVATRHSEDQQTQLSLYASERRWLDAPFWRRRQRREDVPQLRIKTADEDIEHNRREQWPS